MKKSAWLFALLPFLSCWKSDVDIPIMCNSDSTLVSLKVVDFYSNQPLSDVKFQIFEQGFWSVYGPRLFDEFISDSNGAAVFQYEQDSLSYYYLQTLSNQDTSHIYPWRIKVKSGCEHNWKIRMKPAQSLTVTLRNNGPAPFGESYVFVVRRQGYHAKYQNDDIIGNVGYTFGYFPIDTVLVGFEKEFKFKVIPEEELEIQFGDGKTTRVEKVITDNSSSTSFFFSI